MAFLAPIAAAIGSAASTAAGAIGAVAGSASFWSIAGAGAAALGTVGQIMANNQAAGAAMQQARQSLLAAQIDAGRAQRNITRDMGIAASRRAALLAAQGGDPAGSDLITDILYEGSLEAARVQTDLSFQEGVLTQRTRNIAQGTRLSNLGALAQGGARVAGFLT